MPAPGVDTSMLFTTLYETRKYRNYSEIYYEYDKKPTEAPDSDN